MMLDDLTSRAYSAYFASEGDRADQPAALASGVTTDGDRRYVVLRNTNRILAVYRVRRYDGRLKRLRRWPATIEE